MIELLGWSYWDSQNNVYDNIDSAIKLMALLGYSIFGPMFVILLFYYACMINSLNKCTSDEFYD
jgi:hypothetical protein